jgi:DNA helicase II / ATP-dependent DNA helicase PcrA
MTRLRPTLEPTLRPAHQEHVLRSLREKLRPGQQQMADWQGGSLAVTAVPGAGKSTGMAAAVTSAIARLRFGEFGQSRSDSRRQIVVVTFTRSAAASLKIKIRQQLRDTGLPLGGFVVHTLHGLALTIATRYPELSGLALETATLVSPNQSHRLIRTAVERWIAEHPQLYRLLLEINPFDGEETERLRRQSVLRTEVLPALAHTVIHEAKSSGLLPADLQQMAYFVAEGSRTDGNDTPLLSEDLALQIASGLYTGYQTLLAQRNFIDYDDMILGAIQVLNNASARQLLQSQILAVFEDEAQDSTPLQTRLLETLAANPIAANVSPNLIRVGDPNQAINSTFTPADPIFFRQFCEVCQSQDRLATIEQAGRSTQRIIDAANFTLEWVNQVCDRTQGNQAESPFRVQHIQVVGPDDPQPHANPPPEGLGLELYVPNDPIQTIELIAQRTVDLIAQHPHHTVAVLVRENKQGQFLANVLQQPARYGVSIDLAAHNIEILDVGSRDRRSHIPAEILALLQWIDRPHSPDYLKTVLGMLVSRRLIPPQDLNTIATLPEQFLYPGPLDPPVTEVIRPVQQFCRGILKARQELPPYQLIPFLALTLQYDQAELATADKLAERIGQQMTERSTFKATLELLLEIVNSERFDPVEMDEADSTPYLRARQLTIITMHKAKGLDWDYVFIPFLHGHILPGNLWVPPQAKFLGNFTLAEVARAQIRSYLHQQQFSDAPLQMPGVDEAWKRADYLKTAEEYRLLYVAMTRAKRLLWMSAEQKGPFSWSSPQTFEPRSPCPLFPALRQKFPASIVGC